MSSIISILAINLIIVGGMIFYSQWVLRKVQKLNITEFECGEFKVAKFIEFSAGACVFMGLFFSCMVFLKIIVWEELYL